MFTTKVGVYNGAMSDVTRILVAMEQGDPQASAELLPLVYHELRKLAAAKLSQEKPGQTLQPTMLVHEAYLRLVDVEHPQQWNGRGHFFAAAAEAMRRIVIEKARQRRTQKREGVIEHSAVAIREIQIAAIDNWVHTGLAQTAWSPRRWHDAVAAYRAALELKPDDGGMRSRLGFALILAGQTNEGFAEIQEAVRRDPQSADAHYYHAKALRAIRIVDLTRMNRTK